MEVRAGSSADYIVTYILKMNNDQVALVGQVFESYVSEYHKSDIIQILKEDDQDAHYPVVVNAMTLFETNMEVGEYFTVFPDEVLTVFDSALRRSALTVFQSLSQLEGVSMKHNLHARISGLPVCPELVREHIPKTKDVGHFLSVTGTVIRTSLVKVLEFERDYMCNKCKHMFMLKADFEQYYTFCWPSSCPSLESCDSSKFTCLSDLSSNPARCRDYQEIKIQEQVQKLSVGSIPRSMKVILEDDLVDSCKSGDDLTICGVVTQRWKPFHQDVRCEVEIVLKANYVQINNEQSSGVIVDEEVRKEFEEFWKCYKGDPFAGRNEILASLCPQVFGMYLVKLAVAMVLAGGIQRTDATGMRVRGESHLLLVGDPGTGKSQFLKYAARITPRSVLTTGIGSTSAGLTVTAVKDAGEWNLEAGALVLADAGLCCIDEFNSLKEHDRTSIHEAMEQQTISVAKAGLVCKLNTRTTILAATNPKGQYDPQESVAVNIALGSPLLSRFDLILVLLDTKNEDWDRVISSFILENKGYPSEPERLWSMEKMKTYFRLVRTLQPTLSDAGNQVLLRYYQMQRQSDARNAARTTIRLLESLIRLAEAHARLMFRDTVTLEDAVTVVSVMESSMQGGALLGGLNALHTAFPEDPQAQYQQQCRLILERLELQGLLSEELQRLERLQNEGMHPSQLRVVEAEAETTPGSSGGGPGATLKLRTSTQQEPSCSLWALSLGGSPWGSPVLDPRPDLGPSGSPGRKRSAGHREDGSDWGEPTAARRTAPRNSALVSPGSQTAEQKAAVETSDNRSWVKEKSWPGHQGPFAVGQLPSPEAPLQPPRAKGKETKRGASGSEVAAREEELDLAPSAPGRPPRRLQEGGPVLGRPAGQAPAQLQGPSPLQSALACGPEGTSELPTRKRLKVPGSAETPGAPAAKLAKFTFKQKSKLTHSPGSPGTTEMAGPSQAAPQRGSGTQASTAVSTLTSRGSRQPHGEPQQPRLEDVCREERSGGPELEPRTQAGSAHQPSERARAVAPCSTKGRNVHAGTLATLARFSFSPPAESQAEPLPTPGGRNWTRGGPSPPHPPSAPGLGSKRMSFQLQASAEKPVLSKNSLFTLSDLDDEVLDFDWDEELRKKP
ncbi:DNA replication licensing factor MCM9 [Fukomys damarensis]|uniref:DNA helicase MCM9 n=2 Tax=Fukomys damarensis TaxID=885580 RepID=A0A091D1R5_FUKDA|nr:DNA replication licensing factor MCM9 [Fukomys damarensis]